MFKNTTLLDDFKHTLSCFFIWESFRIPNSKKKQRFVSRILIFKNENARNKKTGAQHFYSILQKRDFSFTTKASHCLLWPFLVSRCPGRCPGVPVSRSVSRACSCLSLLPQKCCLSLPPQKCLKTQGFLMMSNPNV